MVTLQQAQNTRSYIDALRSGAYAQGTHSLKRELEGEVTYCFLGIFYELPIAGELQGQWVKVPGGDYLVSFLARVGKYDNTVAPIVAACGLPLELLEKWLADNDHRRKTFPQIADEMEQWLNLQLIGVAHLV